MPERKKRRNYIDSIPIIECMDIFFLRYCILKSSAANPGLPCDTTTTTHSSWAWLTLGPCFYGCLRGLGFFVLGFVCLVGWFLVFVIVIAIVKWGAGVLSFGVCLVDWFLVFFIVITVAIIILSCYTLLYLKSVSYPRPGILSCSAPISQSKWDTLQEALRDYLMISSIMSFFLLLG